MTPAFPRTYSVPRDGHIVEVCVEDRDELRELRTEMELLRRIDRRTAPSQLSAVPLSEGKYTSEDRRELAKILGDARNSAVKACAAIVDQEFDDLRKEILMSVVNEQAEKIAHEIAESGAADILGEQPPSVEDALNAAEAELAKIAALADAGSHEATKPPSHEADDSESRQVETVVPTAAEPVFPSIAPQGLESISSQPIESEPARNTPPTANTSLTPERAEQVVCEIEAGIRKLASILSTEVNDQWKKAESAFHDVLDLRGQAQQAYQNTSAMLAQIAHLKEEMEIARDDAEVARREAKLLRDDARRSKELAEAAAAACTRTSR